MVPQIVSPLPIQSSADCTRSCSRLNNDRINDNQLLLELAESKILAQLQREMELDRLVVETARNSAIDLNYSQAEFDALFAKIAQLPLLCGMNSHQLTAIVDRDLKLQKFKQATCGDRVEADFESQKRRLDRVVISIIKVSDGLMARELFFRIYSQEQSFAEIALDYSEDRYAKNGGTIGEVFLRDLAPAIGRVVANLQPGELSLPVRIGDSHLIIRLDELFPAQLDDRTRQLLLDEMFVSWTNSQLARELN